MWFQAMFLYNVILQFKNKEIVMVILFIYLLFFYLSIWCHFYDLLVH